MNISQLKLRSEKFDDDDDVDDGDNTNNNNNFFLNIFVQQIHNIHILTISVP